MERQLVEARGRDLINHAADLHDGPLQDLYATRFILESPPSAAPPHSEAVLATLLKKVRSDLRTITGELQIPKFETGLADEIRFFAENFQEKHPHLKVSVDAHEPPFVLSSDVQQAIFRIYRSSMSNVAKHALAKNVRVFLVTNSETLSLVIEDDGKGFDLAASSDVIDSDKHYGILLNQHYAHQVGAKFKISSSPGYGAIVSVTYEKPSRGLKKFFNHKAIASHYFTHGSDQDNNSR